MKNYFRLFIFVISLTNIILLVSCSKVIASENTDFQTQDIQEPIIIVEEQSQEPNNELDKNKIIINDELSIDIDTIIAQRDSYKEKQLLTVEEIGEENLSNYILQTFSKELCLDIGNCLCHM